MLFRKVLLSRLRAAVLFADNHFGPSMLGRIVGWSGTFVIAVIVFTVLTVATLSSIWEGPVLDSPIAMLPYGELAPAERIMAVGQAKYSHDENGVLLIEATVNQFRLHLDGLFGGLTANNWIVFAQRNAVCEVGPEDQPGGMRDATQAVLKIVAHNVARPTATSPDNVRLGSAVTAFGTASNRGGVLGAMNSEDEYRQGFALVDQFTRELKGHKPGFVIVVRPNDLRAILEGMVAEDSPWANALARLSDPLSLSSHDAGERVRAAICTAGVYADVFNVIRVRYATYFTPDGLVTLDMLTQRMYQIAGLNIPLVFNGAPNGLLPNHALNLVGLAWPTPAWVRETARSLSGGGK